MDPAIYSRLLMENAKKAAKSMTASAESPKKVLEKAHSQTDVQVKQISLIMRAVCILIIKDLT